MVVVKGPDSSHEQKLTRMVEQYQKPLLNLCYMVLRDRNAAEDAVQETFLKAYKALPTFREESSEKTWLTRIALNTCRDMKKSAWFSHINRSVTPEELPLPVWEDFDQDAADLARAILQLPDKDKEVILLYYYQELTMQEIASTIGITASMVSRRIKKAHARLHGLLGKEYLYG